MANLHEGVDERPFWCRFVSKSCLDFFIWGTRIWENGWWERRKQANQWEFFNLVFNRSGKRSMWTDIGKRFSFEIQTTFPQTWMRSRVWSPPDSVELKKHEKNGHSNVICSSTRHSSKKKKSVNNWMSNSKKTLEWTFCRDKEVKTTSRTVKISRSRRWTCAAAQDCWNKLCFVLTKLADWHEILCGKTHTRLEATFSIVKERNQLCFEMHHWRSIAATRIEKSFPKVTGVRWRIRRERNSVQGANYFNRGYRSSFKKEELA